MFLFYEIACFTKAKNSLKGAVCPSRAVQLASSGKKGIYVTSRLDFILLPFESVSPERGQLPWAELQKQVHLWPTDTNSDKHLMNVYAVQEWRETKHSSYPPGAFIVISSGEFSSVWHLPSKDKEVLSEAASVKCLGRKVGGVFFMSTLQMGKVSWNGSQVTC